MRPARITLLLAAAFGLFALYRFVPVQDAVAQLSTTFDGQRALAATRTVAQQFGCSLTNERLYITSEHSNQNQWWRQTWPSPSAAKFPFALWHITGKSAQGDVAVELSPDGRLVSFACKPSKSASVVSVAPASAGVSRAVFQALAGAHQDLFRELPMTSGAQGVQHFAWEQVSGTPAAGSWSIAADVDGRIVRRAELSLVLGDSVARQWRSWREPVTRVAATGKFLTYLTLILSPLVCIVLAVRRRLQLRYTLTMLAVLSLVSILLTFQSAGDVHVETEDGPVWLSYVMLTFFGAVQGLLYAGQFGVSEMLGRRYQHARWFGMHLALAGRWRNRVVGSSLWAGLLGAFALAPIPVLVSLLPFGVRPVLSIGEHDLLPIVSTSPALDALLPSMQDAVFPVFGLLAAWMAKFARGRWRWLWAAGALLALLIYTSTVSFAAGTPAVLIAGSLVVLVLTLVFYEFGILAVLVSAFTADVVLAAERLFAAPSQSLHVAGIEVFAVLASLAVAGLVLQLKGDTALESEAQQQPAADSAAALVSQREQLKSEFSVAHRAQQQMLPSQAPIIPGLGLAGLCHPARDVGGDLYDYVRLADGRLSICVADVSGKGMPAALYMTFTKGLLAAAAQDSGDISAIARHLNGHLYTAGRRKVFVTAVFGVLDPETNELEYVRAGHNPAVWRRPRTGETKLVQSAGMGLGVGSSRYFDRSLKCERLALTPGDALVFYSDGLTEAMNESLEQFGEDRLMDCVAQTDGLDAAATRDTILACVERFLNGVPAQDDMTIVVLRIEELC